jgi:hypothetical protein
MLLEMIIMNMAHLMFTESFCNKSKNEYGPKDMQKDSLQIGRCCDFLFERNPRKRLLLRTKQSYLLLLLPDREKSY